MTHSKPCGIYTAGSMQKVAFLKVMSVTFYGDFRPRTPGKPRREGARSISRHQFGRIRENLRKMSEIDLNLAIHAIDLSLLLAKVCCRLSDNKGVQ